MGTHWWFEPRALSSRPSGVLRSSGRLLPGASSFRAEVTVAALFVGAIPARFRPLLVWCATREGSAVAVVGLEPAPVSSPRRRRRRPEEGGEPATRDRLPRSGLIWCATGAKWRTRAVEWSNQRASPHGTNGTAARRSPAADPCRTAPRARSAWTRKKSGTKTEDAHSWRQTAKAASIEAGTKSPPTLHEGEARLKGQCRKKRRSKEDSSRKERERAAMGERSAMAGAWKEDEDRERTTRGWTPFGIIALLHTSATRPSFARQLLRRTQTCRASTQPGRRCTSCITPPGSSSCAFRR